MNLTLTCNDLVAYLSDYLDNNLADELVIAAREHLATCQNCRVVLDSTEKTILLFREHGQAQHISVERQHKLFDHLAQALASRQMSPKKT